MRAGPFNKTDYAPGTGHVKFTSHCVLSYAPLIRLCRLFTPDLVRYLLAAERECAERRALLFARVLAKKGSQVFPSKNKKESQSVSHIIVSLTNIRNFYFRFLQTYLVDFLSLVNKLYINRLKRIVHVNTIVKIRLFSEFTKFIEKNV